MDKTTIIEVETKDGAVYQFNRPTLQRILDISLSEESRAKKAESESDELDRVWDEYQASVNMTHDELKKWSDNPCSHMASLSRAPITRNLRLLSTKKSDWGNKEISDAKKTIAFISRMSGNSSGDPVSDECPFSKRTISLMNWAHDPNKSTKCDRTLKKVLSRDVEIALKSDEEMTVFGLVLEPNDGDDGAPLNPDAQGEIYSKFVIRRAAHGWMLNHRMFDVQHEVYLGDHQAKVVESYLAPVDFDLEMPDGSERRIYCGTWLIVVKILDVKLWESIKKGSLTGFSMNGFVSKEKVKVRRKKSEAKPETLCFYHRDQDGAMSAAIVSSFMKSKSEPVDLVSFQYGEPFPFDSISEMKTVYMVDFMPQPFCEMECLAEMCDAMDIELIVIDHHAHTINELNDSDIAGKLEGIQESAELDGPVPAGKLEAGCDLTWRYLFPDKNKPPIVELIGRWDIWDHKNSLVRPVAFALEGQKPGVFMALMSRSTEQLDIQYREIGEAILNRELRNGSSRIKQSSFPVDLDGLKCLAINTDARGPIQFESLDELGIEGYQAGLTFKLNSKGAWVVSMYALGDDTDVGKVCFSHGGSGHRGAGGFECRDLPFSIHLSQGLP